MVSPLSSEVRCSPIKHETAYSHHLDAEFRVAASGMAWRGVDSEDVIAMAAPDIRWAQWIRVARGFQLRIGMRDHRREKFDGFLREVCSDALGSS
jgi:structure-specific recognition protein 1